MYYNDGKQAERDFCKLMEQWGGGILIDDIALQHKDIDIKLRKCGRTVSIKDQHSADKFKCFLFEHTQVRTYDNKEMDGNVLSCEADLYAIATPTQWFIFDASKLKAFLNQGEWKNMYTSKATQEANIRKKGYHCYDRTISWVVSHKVLEQSEAFLYKCKRK